MSFLCERRAQNGRQKIHKMLFLCWQGPTRNKNSFVVLITPFARCCSSRLKSNLLLSYYWDCNGTKKQQTSSLVPINTLFVPSVRCLDLTRSVTDRTSWALTVRRKIHGLALNGQPVQTKRSLRLQQQGGDKGDFVRGGASLWLSPLPLVSLCSPSFPASHSVFEWVKDRHSPHSLPWDSTSNRLEKRCQRLLTGCSCVYVRVSGPYAPMLSVSLFAFISSCSVFKFPKLHMHRCRGEQKVIKEMLLSSNTVSLVHKHTWHFHRRTQSQSDIIKQIHDV